MTQHQADLKEYRQIRKDLGIHAYYVHTNGYDCVVFQWPDKRALCFLDADFALQLTPEVANDCEFPDMIHADIELAAASAGFDPDDILEHWDPDEEEEKWGSSNFHAMELDGPEGFSSDEYRAYCQEQRRDRGIDLYHVETGGPYMIYAVWPDGQAIRMEESDGFNWTDEPIDLETARKLSYDWLNYCDDADDAIDQCGLSIDRLFTFDPACIGDHGPEDKVTKI